MPSAVTFTSKPIFPADIWNHIVNTFLPAYSRVGSHSFHNTCKALSQNGFPKIKKPSIKEVIDSCKTPEDALNILKDPALCEQFSFPELLKIAGCHPKITEHLLQLSMGIDDLSSLASHSISAARLILSSNYSLNSIDKASIVKHHYSLAKEFINNLTESELREVLNYSSLASCKALLRAAVDEGMFDVITDFTLEQHIEYDFDQELGSRLIAHEASPLNMEKCLLDLEALNLKPNRCRAFFLLMSRLGRGHELLDNPKLASHIRSSHLAWLAKFDSTVAKRIFEDQHLKRILMEDFFNVPFDSPFCNIDRKNFDIALLNPSEKFAKEILEDEGLTYQLNGDTLYKLFHSYPRQEIQVLQDNKYDKAISTYLNNFEYSLGVLHPSSELDVFYYHPIHGDVTLSTMSNIGLRIYSARCASVAMAVLKEPNLLNKVYKNSEILNENLTFSLAYSPYVCVNRLYLDVIKSEEITIKEQMLIFEMEKRIFIHDEIMLITKKLLQQNQEGALLRLESPCKVKRTATEESSTQESKKPKR